ncbi:transcription factor HES-1-like [Saccostrea cucullata]|uniref:transcription factor HES-1-like n=1 Tax=Saccostrea cuccullata TaxID=36930 RepID=UPI002ED14826
MSVRAKRPSLAEKMKKASEIQTPLRKANKPQTERKRRERINKCLGQLKSLVMKATGKDEKKFPRLEKADILEMAVNHLYAMNSKDGKQETREPDDRYREGYSRCISEVLHCLRSEQKIDNVTKTNLINHFTVSLRHLSATNHSTGYVNQGFELSSHSDSSSTSGQQLYPSNVLCHEGVQEVPPFVQPKYAEVYFQDQNMYMDFYNAPLDVRPTEVYSAIPDRVPTEFQPPRSPFHSDIGVPLHTSTPVAKKRLSVIPSFPALEDINLSDCVTTSSSSDSGSSAGPWRPW